uniref:Uncharacterized protein n=1 Tax=Glossina pallidipes TaxID=7398 RepID=A0A1B0A257_GLOPL
MNSVLLILAVTVSHVLLMCAGQGQGGWGGQPGQPGQAGQPGHPGYPGSNNQADDRYHYGHGGVDVNGRPYGGMGGNGGGYNFNMTTDEHGHMHDMHSGGGGAPGQGGASFSGQPGQPGQPGGGYNYGRNPSHSGHSGSSRATSWAFSLFLFNLLAVAAAIEMSKGFSSEIIPAICEMVGTDNL